ncbi:hypothetical protein MPTK1_1g14890 [Marchantia polymorpha subsp. ruderalis]|uniref:F-box domain-containing protein n=2 Tax=Marchantia polymorpha TaxID=3197 RepID=A0AAF6AQA1_MARPO|nr:hypothetical protein MARPO_0153s0001 [Marchantia polymorpha]BBM98621.1 hypothetical protein Mp_1g14890 [Marchantia polymorpha subsp. ruderalis]|eukprot:PTQ28828.1 hypothetical protein MARPO_0153s0001 [Marchantia polymorpha]
MELEREDHRPRDSWDSLPVELLIKVLRDQDLPISTLAECRAVCKKWKQIIDGPDLRNKIWNQSAILYDACIDSTAYFCLGDRWIGRYISFEPKEVVAADGGLMCFNQLLSTEFVIYNPVVDKYLSLKVPHEIDGVSTVFNGMLECIVVGLVVDQFTKHFKVVLGGVPIPDRRTSLIYDSTTSTWSWLINKFPVLLNWMEVECHSGRCLVCNGSLYWIVWDPRFMIKALLIFNLTEETWNILFEEIMEDMPGALQVAAYEGCVCLLAMDWTDVEFDRRSYDGNFLRHRMVRKMDRSLIRRTKDLWVMEDGRPFKFYATGGSDVFFVFEEEGEELEVAKYSAELDMIYFLADPPFRGAHEFHLRGFLPHVIHTWEFMPHVIHDPWCAIIPTPGVNAEQEWITQPQRHLLQEVRETPREEDVGEV